MNRPANLTPSLIEVIGDLIEDRLHELNTCMPGKVVAINQANGLLTIEPCYQRLYQGDDEPVALPLIEGVPLANIRAGNAIISMPVKKDDFVTLWFSQRSLENWKEAGKTGIPGDTRLHHISDAIAYPGGYPVSKALKVDPDALQIKFGGTKITLKENEVLDLECSKAKIHMTKDGKFTIGNGSVNLLKVVKDGFTELEAHATAMATLTVPTALGPSGTPINAADFLAVKINIGKVLQLLEQILGD